MSEYHLKPWLFNESRPNAIKAERTYGNDKLGQKSIDMTVRKGSMNFTIRAFLETYIEGHFSQQP